MKTPPDIARIKKRLPELVDALIDLGLGVRVVDKCGELAYEKPPDRQAIAYLMDRVWGRSPSAKVDPPGQALEGRVVITLPHNDRDAPPRDSIRSPAGPPIPIPSDES